MTHTSFPSSPHEALIALVEEYEKLGVARDGVACQMIALGVGILVSTHGTSLTAGLLERTLAGLPDAAAEIKAAKYRCNN
jgi:hypothetical protein